MKSGRSLRSRWSGDELLYLRWLLTTCQEELDGCLIEEEKTKQTELWTHEGGIQLFQGPHLVSLEGLQRSKLRPLQARLGRCDCFSSAGTSLNFPDSSPDGKQFYGTMSWNSTTQICAGCCVPSCTRTKPLISVPSMKLSELLPRQTEEQTIKPQFQWWLHIKLNFFHFWRSAVERWSLTEELQLLHRATAAPMKLHRTVVSTIRLS